MILVGHAAKLSQPLHHAKIADPDRAAAAPGVPRGGAGAPGAGGYPAARSRSARSCSATSMIMSSWPPTSRRSPTSLQDLVRRDAVALGGPLGVQQEAGVDARRSPSDQRRAVERRQLACMIGRDDVLGGVERSPCTSTPVAMPSRSNDGDEHLGRRVAGARRRARTSAPSICGRAAR